MEDAGMKRIIYFVDVNGLVGSFHVGHSASYRLLDSHTVYHLAEDGEVIGEYDAHYSLTDLARIIEGVQ